MTTYPAITSAEAIAIHEKKYSEEVRHVSRSNSWDEWHELQTRSELLTSVIKCNKFGLTTLTKGMFFACDEYGKPLSEPEIPFGNNSTPHEEDEAEGLYKEFEDAESRVLFSGWEHDTESNGNVDIAYVRDYTIRFYPTGRVTLVTGFLPPLSISNIDCIVNIFGVVLLVTENFYKQLEINTEEIQP